MNPNPPAPRGVYITTRNGERIPVPVEYVGVSADGRHQWHSIDKFTVDEALTATSRYCPPLTDVNVLIRPHSPW